MSRYKLGIMLLGAMSLMCSTAAHADDQIRISGSSTVFPYSRLVADRFHAAYPKFKAPVVESGGSGAGIKEFCRSDAENSLDIANASRPMSESEYRSCVAAGVKDIQKITFGHDGIVLATNKAASDKWQVTPKDVYLALAKQIMKNNKLIPNPYTQWNEVNSKLPSWNIEAYIPGEKHGTREVFEEKMLLAGCKESGVYDAMAKQGMDPKAIKNACIAVRKDGKSVDIDGDYTETLSRLASNPKSVGFFGLAFYENNADKLNVASVNGVIPSAETVANGTYPLSRPLYFYVKRSHLRFRPGLKEYVNYFLSDAMVGDDGEVVDAGLVASPKAEREKQRQNFNNGVIMTHGS